MRAAAAAMLAGLASCATLPAPEATAFHQLATANRDAFAGLVATEDAAVTGLAVRDIGANGARLLSHDCAARATAPCRLTYRSEGADIVLGEVAPNTRRLIGAIARYGEQMAALAEAKDIATLDDRAEAAGGAVQALLGVVFPGAAAAATPIVDAAVLAFRGRLVAKRRHLLLVNALAAKPAIDIASRTMGEIAGPIRDNISIASANALRRAERAMDESGRAEQAFAARADAARAAAAHGDRSAPDTLDRIGDRIDALHATRAAQADAAIRAARALNDARGLETDFGGLARAHDGLIAKLRDPKVPIEGAIADLDAFLARLDGLAGAHG